MQFQIRADHSCPRLNPGLAGPKFRAKYLYMKQHKDSIVLNALFQYLKVTIIWGVVKGTSL